MNIPRDLYNGGVYASIAISIIVTKVQIIIMNIGIRVIGGIWFLSADTIAFDPNRTNKAAPAIPIAFSTDVVTASTGHSPSTRLNIGLSFTIPLKYSPEIVISAIIHPS